jgi:dephospho-CoA kinase
VGLKIEVYGIVIVVADPEIRLQRVMGRAAADDGEMALWRERAALETKMMTDIANALKEVGIPFWMLDTSFGGIGG